MLEIHKNSREHNAAQDHTDVLAGGKWQQPWRVAWKEHARWQRVR